MNLFYLFQLAYIRILYKYSGNNPYTDYFRGRKCLCLVYCVERLFKQKNLFRHFCLFVAKCGLKITVIFPLKNCSHLDYCKAFFPWKRSTFLPSQKSFSVQRKIISRNRKSLFSQNTKLSEPQRFLAQTLYFLPLVTSNLKVASCYESK